MSTLSYIFLLISRLNRLWDGKYDKFDLPYIFKKISFMLEAKDFINIKFFD